MAKRKKKSKLMGLLFLLFSLLFFLSQTLYSFYEEKEEIAKVESFFNPETTKKAEDYLGVLEIPSLNLKKGFYSYTSSKNDVDKNIELVYPSNFDDVSTIVLASHSGTSRVSHFKNLKELKIGDMAFLYYNDKKITYQLIQVYQETKNGTIHWLQAKQKELILTTCDSQDKTKQFIYVFQEI